MFGKKHNLSDGLENLANMFANKRNAYNTNQAYSRIIDDFMCGELASSGITARVIAIKVSWALRNGFIFKSDEQEKYFKDNIEDKLYHAITSMLTYGRGIFILNNDDTDTNEVIGSINRNNIKIIDFEGALTAVAVGMVNNDILSPRYWKPEIYNVRGTPFHHSRVIDFVYKLPPLIKRPAYYYGGISEVELIYDQIIADSVMQRAVPAIFEKSSNYIYKLPNLHLAVSTGKEDEIFKFFTRLESIRSSYGASLVDAQTEVTTVNQSLSNMSETNNFTLQRIALVTGIPLPFLVGESIKGLNSTGDHEMTIMSSTITSLQNRYILPKLNELFKLLGFEPCEIRLPDELNKINKANLEKTMIETAVMMSDLGLDPTEYLIKNDFKVSNLNEYENENEPKEE